MDPNETLERIRAVVAEWRRTEDTGDATEMLEELAGHVEALDGWLSGSGFVPLAWAAAPRPASPVATFLVTVDADGEHHLQCPSCMAIDEITEVDHGGRWNTGEPTFEDGELVHLAYRTGQSDFYHDRYQCGSCMVDLLLPDGADPDEEWN